MAEKEPKRPNDFLKLVMPGLSAEAHGNGVFALLVIAILIVMAGVLTHTVVDSIPDNDAVSWPMLPP